MPEVPRHARDDAPTERKRRLWPTARAFQRFELKVEVRLRDGLHVTFWSPLLTEALSGAAHGYVVAGVVKVIGGTWPWTACAFYDSALLWWLLVGGGRLYFRRKKLLSLEVTPSR